MDPVERIKRRGYWKVVIRPYVSQAKKLIKEKTGRRYTTINGLRIFKLKTPTLTRKYFVGSHMEWLNL